MASKHVEDAVTARLKASWTASPVLLENEEADAPETGSPFLRLQFPVASTERLSLTSRLYREVGGFRIIINVERGDGTGKIRDWGEQLAALFRDVTFDGVHCLVPSEPFTDERSDQGNYFQGSMVVPFWRCFPG